VLVQNRWPFRLHATYDESISRFLDVYEKVNREIPFDGLHWCFDHAETISQRSLDRVAKLGGGIAIQHRMAYQGEFFAERYGAEAAGHTPPVRRIIDSGVKVSAGTDATRVASYNPWISLAWLTTGRTVGGMRLYPESNLVDRLTALRMWTEWGPWFSNDEGRKGRLEPGWLADLAVLDRDYFRCPEDEIADITSVLTIVGGKVVHGADEFKPMAPPLPAPMPDWSPVRGFGGYQHKLGGTPRYTAACGCASTCAVHGHSHLRAWGSHVPASDLASFWGAMGCACFAI
jgi:predicted amidohydrolase YtcJ